ncbi:Hypothetical protein CAP_2869 [Chondromyces apiculatus DSM 436]|uniref:Keratin associated protein n=2 Tax=Chondromyces apiculatus TaxID=51 RepID=A0A017TAB5_9BACT|nr:Hypothetical protein CAP_2869 [Chondromyces apiculatus DSM 436]
MPKGTMPSLRLAALPLMFGALTAPAMLSGCDGENPLGNIAEQCGLTCSGGGVLEGRANISGTASIDAFFGAVVDFTGAANGVTANVRTQLDAMAASLGLEAGAPAADIRAALEAKISANVSGGLTVKAEPPRCEASVEVTASAAASCDVNVDPGSVEVRCEGSCTIDASAQADCSANGTLTCKGQAPNLECEGKCTGDCDLEVAAQCEGTCRGTCNGECSVRDSAGNCKGTCSGTCEGTCELTAGGSCTGKCEGSCEYTPPSGSCSANAEVRCEASAQANVQCKGGCDGKVTPPSVSAECKASVEAKAEASVECKPPSLEVSWQFAAGVNADAQADFRAWVGNFKGQFSALLAAFAKAEILVDTGANLIGAADGAVKGVVDNLSASADLKASIGAGCALAELPNVATAINGAAGGLQESVSAVVEIQGAVGM